MSIANENYDTGGTGAAIFGGPHGAVPTKAPTQGSQPLGDEYVAPKGLPGWKQPSYDEDDRVDPNKYPEPKTGVTKGATTLLTRCFPDPTQAGLVVAKLFYFFFYAAFGSLFPLMGVYFKQIGMDAAQAGFLSGIRPIVEALAIPFWNNIASRLHKGKIMMMISLACWIIFTQPIGHIHPPVVSCKYYNGTKVYLQQPLQSNDHLTISRRRKKRSLTPETVDEPPLALPLASNLDPALTLPIVTEQARSPAAARWKRNVGTAGAVDIRETSWKEGYVVGKSPQVIDFTDLQMHHQQWVSPRFNNEVFEREGVHKVFFLILLLIVIGEFFRYVSMYIRT